VSRSISPRTPRIPGGTPRRWWAGAALAAACLASLVIAVLASRSTPPENVWLTPGPERQLEARLAFAAADHYRPLIARKMGEAPARVPKLPLEALSRLDEAHDARGLAAAYLVRADQSLADQALAALAPLESTPEVQTDRAAALLLKGLPAQALQQLAPALERGPSLPQPLWNRALALRELGLPLLAARGFSALALQQEPGWAEEASRRAGELQAVEQARKQRWLAYRQRTRELVTEARVPSPAELAESPPSLRLHFYDAVRTRTSREEVLALLPLARELDRQAGGAVLERYLQWTASRDFTRRAPRVRKYALLRQDKLPPEQLEGFLMELLGSSEDDLLMGALIWAEAVPRYLDVFEARAQASQDPWFQLLATQERAKVLLAQGGPGEARRLLEGALQRCAPITYRCLTLRLELIGAETLLLDLDEAWKNAEQGREQARSVSEWNKETEFLSHLAQLSRLRTDFALASAYFGETLERQGSDPRQQRYVHQNLALLALDELRFDRARAEIDQALATGLPLTHVGALALSDVSRRQPSPSDEEALRRALSEAPATTTPGQRAQLRHAQGRFLLEKDLPRGRASLEELLRETSAAGQDVDLHRARAYSFTSLILERGKAGEYEAALELFGRELDTEVPRQCAVALTEDLERSLLIVRGADGRVLGSYEGARQARWPTHLEGLLPREALEALRSCEQVEVFARPPLRGRAGLLPPELAWSYRTRSGPPREAPRDRAIHLLVKDVELSPERASTLGRLHAWTPGFGEREERRVLERAEATPSRVLAAMRDATEIDLVTHGLISRESDASYLVLAMEGGRDELSATRIREQRLEGAPLVVIAACHAAHPAPTLHDLGNLPGAFVQAGARAVLAATVEIPDLEAAAFFNSIRERLRQGASPSTALRDERLKWLEEAKEGRTWVEGILLFN